MNFDLRPLTRDMAEEGNENQACLVDCFGAEGPSVAAELLTELSGSSVDTAASSVSWHFDNKYYSAEVTFTICHPDSRELLEEDQPWEAIVVLCNINKPDSLEAACKIWELVEDHSSPSVCLLVGTTTPATADQPSCHQKALEWCVGRGFELVEWERGPGGGYNDSEEDDFPEMTGVARVSEALQAHIWPNMIMKKQVREKQQPGERRTRDDGGKLDPVEEPSRSEEQHTETSAAVLREPSAEPSDPKETPKISQERIDSLLSAEEVLASGLSDEQDPGGESFEQLFARFAQMKEHAQSLPHEDRKAFAEKVVMAFWNAIGGDEDEIKDTDSDTLTS